MDRNESDRPTLGAQRFELVFGDERYPISAADVAERIKAGTWPVVLGTTCEPLQEHEEYSNWEAGTTREQIIEGLHEQIGEHEEKSAELRRLGRSDIAEQIDRHVKEERRQLRQVQTDLALERRRRNRGHEAAVAISFPRRTHGTRRRACARRSVRRSCRAGPSSGDPPSTEGGDDDPPRPRRALAAFLELSEGDQGAFWEAVAAEAAARNECDRLRS